LIADCHSPKTIANPASIKRQSEGTTLPLVPIQPRFKYTSSFSLCVKVGLNTETRLHRMALVSSASTVPVTH
jgi:hypothetical protein